MSLRVGRIPAETLGNVERVTSRGDAVAFEGRVSIGDEDLTAARWAREQLRGLVDNVDEDVTRLVWDEDPWYDGFVHVRGGDVTIDPGGLKRGWFPWRLEIDRVPGHAIPWAEARLVGWKRSNAHSIPDGSAGSAFWHGVPGSIVDYGHDFDSNTTQTRTGETGPVLVHFPGSTAGDGRRLGRFTVRPADWYQGSPEIQWGPDLRAVIGRQLPGGDPTDGWALTNGLFRIAGSGTAGQVEISAWKTSTNSWSTPKAIRFRNAADATIDVLTSITVLRNGPALAAIRLGLGFSSDPSSSLHTLDVSLRRGARFAECMWRDGGLVGSIGKVQRATAEAGSALTYSGADFGIEAASDDADGFRYVMFSPRAVGVNTIQGGVSRLASGAEMPFGIGLSVSGSGLYEPPAYLGYQYHHPYAERLVVVGR